MDPTLKSIADKIIVDEWNDEARLEKLMNDIKHPDKCTYSNGCRKSPACEVTLPPHQHHNFQRYKFFFKDTPWNVTEAHKYTYNYLGWGFLSDHETHAASHYLETRWKDKYSA